MPLNYRLADTKLRALLAKHPRAIALAEPQFHSLFDPGARVWSPEEWLKDAAAGSAVVDPDPGSAAPAAIIYTSGTTSEPEGVLLGHQHLTGCVLGSVEFGNAELGDTSIVNVSPYHIAAVANAVSNLYAGCRCIVLEQFTGEQWLDIVREEGVTHALVVPTILARILDAATQRLASADLPQLRALAYGGAPMPLAVIERALRLWPHVDFVNAYGLTETSSTIAVLDPDDRWEALASSQPEVRARLRSVGHPLPGVEVEIRGPDGLQLPAGRTGRVFVRGRQVSGEYAGIGSILDAEGFFDTRDEGYMDEAGYLFLSGRTDDTIIRGGENIAPSEIEETLLAFPGVEDAVVVGVPDEEWGQRLEAAVVTRAGADIDPASVRGFVRSQLRSSKTPDRIVIWDELPRSELGKVLRRTVVARLQAEPFPELSLADQVALCHPRELPSQRREASGQLRLVMPVPLE